jgi:hypothetical protein
MKTALRAALVAGSVSLSLGLALVGCSQNLDDSTSSTGSALSAALSSSVLHAEPGSVPSDYHLAALSLRLFGTQPNADGGGYATIADKSTWQTKNVAVGDWLTRNYQLAAVTKDGVTLRGAAGNVTLASGKDMSISALYHRFDTAAVYQGKNVWQIDGKTFADIHAAYGAGAVGQDRSGVGPTAAIGTVSTVVLTSIDPNGVLAHAGLRPSSVLMALNGTTLHAADLDTVATALTKSGTTVSLTISEHGAVHAVTYNIH